MGGVVDSEDKALGEGAEEVLQDLGQDEIMVVVGTVIRTAVDLEVARAKVILNKVVLKMTFHMQLRGLVAKGVRTIQRGFEGVKIRIINANHKISREHQCSHQKAVVGGNFIDKGILLEIKIMPPS